MKKQGYFQTLILVSLLLTGIAKCQSSDSVLELTLLKDYEKARCIDGSPSGFYFREGTGSGKNNFMIHLQGGAWCQGTTEDEIIQNCLARSKTSLGSSSEWPQNMTNTGNVNSSKELNPAFYNWNQIFVNYCDGFTYQGNSQRVIDSNTTLYFRGKDNMLALFDYLIQKKGLNNANRIILSGSSAGGIGATNWSSYLRSIIPQSTLVQSIIDSGFFVDDGWFDPTMWRLLMDIAYNNKREEIVPANCEYLKDDSELFKCIQPAYTYKQLQIPSLFLLSSYDTYVLAIQKKVKCLVSKNSLYSFKDCTEEQWKIIDQLRIKTIETLSLVAEQKQNISVWTVSCIDHMFELDQIFYNSGVFTAPYPNGVTPSEAIVQFLSEPFSQKSYIDLTAYPGNQKCSYLVNIISQQ